MVKYPSSFASTLARIRLIQIGSIAARNAIGQIIKLTPCLDIANIVQFTINAVYARYTNDWTVANGNRSGRFLVIIESWNELFEGTNISESTTATNYPDQGADSWGSDPRLYIDITAQYAKSWNDNIDFNCMFIDDSISTTMAAGSVYNATITVRNIGDDKWQGSSFLLAQDDTDGVPGLFHPSTPSFINNRRVGLGLEQIYRGKPLTFNVVLQAPLISGVYTPQWKMVKDSSILSTGSLGKTINVTQPTSARFWQLYK